MAHEALSVDTQPTPSSSLSPLAPGCVPTSGRAEAPGSLTSYAQGSTLQLPLLVPHQVPSPVTLSHSRRTQAAGPQAGWAVEGKRARLVTDHGVQYKLAAPSGGCQNLENLRVWRALRCPPTSSLCLSEKFSAPFPPGALSFAAAPSSSCCFPSSAWAPVPLLDHLLSLSLSSVFASFHASSFPSCLL